MKRLSMIIAAGILIALNGTALAEVSKDERNLEREAKRLSDTAAKPDGEKAVVKRLAEEFQTTESQVQALRDRKLGYGEVAVVLSLAQSLPGGATDANVQKVLALRQGPPVMGWGQVAGQLGTKLNKTVTRVKKMNNEAHREIKKEHAHAGKDPKPAPAEQKPAMQEPAKPHYQGDGRLLPHGTSAQ